MNLSLLTHDQLDTLIEKIAEPFNRLNGCLFIQERTKLFTPHLLDLFFYESLKKDIQIFRRIHNRLLNEWERRNPTPIRYIDFSGGGSHRKIEQDRRLLRRNNIIYWMHNYGIGRSQYLKIRIQVHSYYGFQMKTLGFKKARSK